MRLGTRGSLLARTQSALVARDLEKAHPGLTVQLITVKTSGDQITDRPLHEVGGKGLFTKELEQALLAGEVDFAVHSFKDVPTTMPLVSQDHLTVAAVPLREDARDALITPHGSSIEQLPPGARVGTGSFRRRCQLLAARGDLQIVPIRGNVDTRLRKLREGEFDAVVLAMAGVRRVGMFDASLMRPIDPQTLLPAPAQGALALQCRRDDAATLTLLAALDDPATARCVAAERKLVELLNGDCLSPIAALAQIEGDQLTLRAAVGARGGELPVLRSTAAGPAADPSAVAKTVFENLAAQGVEAHLHAHQI